MACVYSIGPVKKDGKAPIFIRVQSKKLKVNIQRKVGLSVLPSIWKMDRDSYAFKKYKTSEAHNYAQVWNNLSENLEGLPPNIQKAILHWYEQLLRKEPAAEPPAQEP